MNGLLFDLQLAVRSLARRPGFTAVVLLTLALGVGATSTVWSFVRGMLLDPLPYPDAERLVMVWQDYRERGGPEREWFSYPNFLDYREHGRRHGSLDDLAVFGGWAPTLSAEATEMVSGAQVSWSFFRVLGVEPVAGRDLAESDDRPGAPQVVLATEGFARRHGLEVGSDLTLSGTTWTLVGLLPEGFRFAPVGDAELWAPLALDAEQTGRGSVFLRAVGRLAPGVTIEAAQAELSTVAARLGQTYAEELTGVDALVRPLGQEVVRQARGPLLMLLAAVAALLLVACVNVAHLLLARGVSRAPELAVRSALGAGRTRLVRQLLVEGLLLALAGGAAGALCAGFGVETLSALIGAGGPVPRLDEVAVDPGVVLFSFAVALAGGLLFGAVPAWSATRRDPGQALTHGARGGGERSGARLSRGLVAAESALALALLVTSGLLLSSFVRLSSTDPGFRPEGLVTFALNTPPSQYPENHHVAALYDRLLAELEALPGVTSVAAVSALPLRGVGNTDASFTVEGQPAPPPGERQVVWYRKATPGYFRTAGLELLAGRGLAATDRPDAPTVAVVNLSFVRRHLPEQDPLGVRLDFGSTAVEIVGVVGDVRSFGLDTEEPPALYLSFDQLPNRFMDVVLRHEGEPGPVQEAARRVLHDLDPRLAAGNLTEVTALVAGSVATERATMLMAGFFGVSSLLLAGLGLYGVVSYATRRRVREIGVRMALGARAADVLRLVVGQGLVPVALGIAAGLLLAWGAARVLESQLYGVDGLDPAVLSVSLLLLAAAALVATLLPARRATRVDPVRALKE